jgi:hypothetical protein
VPFEEEVVIGWGSGARAPVRALRANEPADFVTNGQRRGIFRAWPRPTPQRAWK